MNKESIELPATLILTEDGQWETPSWARTSDDDQWISRLWKAWTYEGHVFHSHQDQGNVKQWLADNGYQDTGDGKHYRRGLIRIDIDRIIESQGYASFVNVREYIPGNGRVSAYHTVYAIEGHGRRRKRYYLGGLATLSAMSEADLVQLIATKTAKSAQTAQKGKE